MVFQPGRELLFTSAALEGGEVGRFALAGQTPQAINGGECRLAHVVSHHAHDERRQPRELLREAGGRAAHGRGRVVELVRQPRGEPAQRHHLLALLLEADVAAHPVRHLRNEPLAHLVAHRHHFLKIGLLDAKHL